MKLYEIVEKISTAVDREQAEKYMAYARTHFPEFDFIMKLNNSEIEIEGISRDFNPPIKNKEQSEFGRSIGWFWKAGTPFKFLLSVRGSLNFSPAKKEKVLLNMVNSIPFDEVQVFLTAMRKELIDCEGVVNRHIDTHKFKGILAILSDKNIEEEVVEKKVIETVVDDNIVIGKTVTEELIEPPKTKPKTKKKKNKKSKKVNDDVKGKFYYNPDNKSQVWKGKGRKPKWLTELLDAGIKVPVVE